LFFLGKEGESSPSVKKSWEAPGLAQMSIDPERNQPVSNRWEAEIRVRNEGSERTRPPRVKERMDVKLYVLAWISQSWSGLVRKLPSQSLCIHLFNNNNNSEEAIPAVDQVI